MSHDTKLWLSLCALFLALPIPLMSIPSHSSDLPADHKTRCAPRSFPWKWIVLVLLGAVCVVVFVKFYRKPAAVSSAGATTDKAGRGGGGLRAVPVATAAVKAGEFHVFLNALGTVSALNTVTVKSRVDGELLTFNFTEGQVVKAGDLLAEIDPRSYEASLAQAEGQLARDFALLANARLDLERYANAEAAVTQQQLATAKSLLDQYIGAVKSDQGVVALARLQLSYCRILSPIAGRVGLRQVDQGNQIKSSDATGLVVITQERPITVIFSLPEDTVPTVRKSLGTGQPLRVTAFDRANKTIIAQGKVSALDNQIDPTTGTVRLKAIFDNGDDSLFPNQFVNVRLLVEEQSGALLLPSAAVQINGPARFVFVVKGDTVERRPVVTGKTDGEITIVEKGLVEGELVVTDGLDKLQDGTPVSLREAVGSGSTGGAVRTKNGDRSSASDVHRKDTRAAPAAP